MIEVKKGLETIDLPYTIRLYGVTEDMFDELADEDTKAELIDGVMIVHSPASIEHDDLSGFIRALMSFYVDARSLGKVLGPDSLVHLMTGRKCAPDVFFVSQERVTIPLPKAFQGAPELVVEVLSPSNREDDLQDKRYVYQEAGVDEIWFVDPENQQVIIDRRQADNYTEAIVTEGKISSLVMTGFWLHAAWLWGKPLPNRLVCLQDILSQP